ncbi:MAG TPA: sigma-70 family RNA polymerase sigma factor [Polyangiaceae bacterium]|nr:sigma-70 family RNA polymerase sigma factor [Polyangiaceae bacterium]
MPADQPPTAAAPAARDAPRAACHDVAPAGGAAPGEGAAGDEARRAPSPEVVRLLVDNHREFLRFLERRVGRTDLAEDLLQEAFVRGIDRAGALRDDESALAWFYRTLRNAVVDYHRRRGSAERALASFAAELEAHEAPEGEVHDAVCQCVGRLAETLKPEYAEALRRIEVQGLPVKAFAEEQGISSGNAAVRVFRAREALRRQVAASCGSCAEHGCLNCTCAPPP